LNVTKERIAMKPFLYCVSKDEMLQLLEAPGEAHILRCAKNSFYANIWAYKGRSSTRLSVFVSWADNWDYASVSLPDRWPTWDEMETVRNAVWESYEIVAQYHPAPSVARIKPYRLHLWARASKLVAPPYEVFDLVPEGDG
jgi:hypothetical protein